MSPRRRMIDPEIWRNEKVGALPDAGRLLFIGIFSNADDDGRLKASPKFLKATIFPYDEDKTVETVRKLRDNCACLGLIRVYSKNGREYLDIPGWHEHQVIRKDRYNASQLPSLDEADNQVTPTPSPEGNQPTPTPSPEDNQPTTVGKHSIVKSSLIESSLDRIPTVSATPSAALEAHTEQNSPKKRQKPKQVETGIFLDMVQQHIGTKLVQRSKLQGQIRPLFVKFPEATPENLLECFKWLRENDPYCRARDSPMVVSLLPSKYPEWAAGKLPALGGKEERYGKPREHKQHTNTKSYEWEEAPVEPDDTS